MFFLTKVAAKLFSWTLQIQQIRLLKQRNGKIIFFPKATWISLSTSPNHLNTWEAKSIINTFFNLTIRFYEHLSYWLYEAFTNKYWYSHSPRDLKQLCYIYWPLYKRKFYRLFFFFTVLVGICSPTAKFLYMNVISCWNIEMLPSTESQDFKSVIFLLPKKGHKSITSISWLSYNGNSRGQ